MSFCWTRRLTFGGFFFSAILAQAQGVDTAVRVPQTAPPLKAPSMSPNFRINGGPLLSAVPGGATFVLNQLKFSGNTLFGTEQLQQQVAKYMGQPIDFAGLEQMANAISQFYRDAGYPFARAYLPEQDVKGGVVELEVLEGRYGRINAVNAPAASPAMVLQAKRNKAMEDVLTSLTLHFQAAELTQVVRSIDQLFDARMQTLEAEYAQTDVERTPNPAAEAFLKHLSTGDVIEAQAIERIALILDDIPGYAAVPVVRPGSARGSGDLEVRMIEDDAWLAVSGFDNYGSKASGRNRLRFDLAKSRNAVFGDLLSFTGLVTDEKTWLTSYSYALPVNSSGLRLQTSLMLSRYKLGEGEFANLADGDTDRLGFKLSYPLVRTQSRNLTLSGGIEHTQYSNTLMSVTEKYNMDAIPLGVNFDWRDAFGGGAVTYGSATVQFNSVGNDARAVKPDSSYSLFNLYVGRQQRINDRVNVAGRLAIQHAKERIDSSQAFSLGGVNGVRAYPVGEFSGYSGSSLQLELSYSLPQYSSVPYVFFDMAEAKRLTTQNLHETRSLSGYGVGVRVTRLGLSMDLTAAWNSAGGNPVSEPGSRSPRLWFSLSNRY